jgi:hypothetical protein
MVGTPDHSHLAPVRLHGWVRALEVIGDGEGQDDELRALWTEHRDALLAEAKTAGFTPAGALWFDKGEGVQDGFVLRQAIKGRDRTLETNRAAWSLAFCQRWGY